MSIVTRNIVDDSRINCCCLLLAAKNLHPHMLVHENCLPDLNVPSGRSDAAADCVILGDATDNFSYANMNAAFRVLIKTGGDLYTMGRGKYYREDEELTLDVGPYAAALECATSKEAIVVGKPSKDFFHAALRDMRVEAEYAVMVGDDVASDVGGAQAAGLRGILVRTGKFTEADERHPQVKPDGIVDNLAEVVVEILA